VELLDADAGHARVRMTNSAYVYAFGPDAGRNVCYMFNGSLSGGMEFVTHDLGGRRKMQCREIECAANGADDCLFEVQPA
jgi:predicted hydrocarbon binding protein